MANINCPNYVQGYTARVTRLDECGNPEFGECGYAVSDGYIQISATSNVEDGDEFKQKNAHGTYLVNQRSRPLLNWVDISMQFSRVDFELFNIITGMSLIVNDAAPTPLTVGLGLTESNFATANFALETWMGNSEEECDPAGLPFYGYNLWPWVVEGAWAPEEVVITNDLISFTITGRTRGGTPWDVGPWDVILDNVLAPSPLLAPLPTDAHWWFLQTQLAPPDDACGCSELAS
jgi:hypothetical protein